MFFNDYSDNFDSKLLTIKSSWKACIQKSEQALSLKLQYKGNSKHLKTLRF